MIRQINKIYLYVKKYWIWIILFLGSGVMLLAGLTWLFLSILIVYSVFKLVNGLLNKLPNQYLRNVLKNVFLLMFVIVVTTGSKLLIVDIFGIPSSSMENTLFPKDIILVNKLAYGPTLTEFPFRMDWCNFFDQNSGSAKKKLTVCPWSQKRWSGYSQINRGDVMVFHDKKKEFFVKRCIGISGDTLKLSLGEVYTNGERYKSPGSVKNQYKLELKNKYKFQEELDSLGITVLTVPPEINSKNLVSSFSNDELNKVQNLKNVERIERKIDTFDAKKRFFVYSVKPSWTLDNMGPFIIPQKGMVINLNSHTYDLYQKAIRVHEQVELLQKNGQFFIDGKEASTYIFKKNYYFVLGDNRKESVDSRFTGFVPEESIIGRVEGVFFSNYSDKFNWERLFKVI